MMAELTTLVVCACGHVAIDHHFGEWKRRRHTGTEGRGLCAHPKCPCKGFRRPEVAA